LCAQPDFIAYDNWAVVVLKGRRRPVVAASTQKDTLGYAYIVANPYRLQVEYPGVFAYPAIISNGQFPGPQDSNAMANKHIVTDFRAE
jgi:hypothetical protein